MTSLLVDHLRRRIRRNGPISFRDYMDAVLYHPEFGYYSRRDAIGKRGDFYTAGDLDPVFGTLLARQFVSMAAEIGLPAEQFHVVELGAGNGTLARDILRETAFRYSILERSAALRHRQQDLLSGREVSWVEELPKNIAGCVFSNEFFDALPVHRLVRREGRLREIFVTEDFTEIEGDPSVDVDVPLVEGQLADISTDALQWIERIGGSIGRGYHLAIDYGYLDREFFARPRGTLMCYWRHRLSENPYDRIGEQDITAHVNFTDLIRTGQGAGLQLRVFSTQMDFLIQAGILTEIEKLAGSRDPSDIERLQAIKKLILPGSMGERFKVLIQHKTGQREAENRR
jgi:SAM-dependent MidA family methyltransferase